MHVFIPPAVLAAFPRCPCPPAYLTVPRCPHACLPALPCPARSGRVYKVEYHGEVVAAKEVPLDKGADAQAAFILVSSQAGRAE